VKIDINELNYTGASSSILKINPIEANIIVSDLIQSYDGTPKPVTVTTSPLGVLTKVIYENSEIVPSTPGNYLIQTIINDQNYFGESSTDTLVIFLITGINPLKDKEVLIYPNPTSDYVTIKGEDRFTLKITNSIGKIVYENNINGSIQIDASYYQRGVYILQLITPDSVIRTRKMVVK
jgi:hypothetical protein